MWGTPALAGSKRIRPSVLLASHSGHRSLYPIHGRRSSSPCSAHSLGKASSLFGGRILKCFPHPIAPSAARTVAGPTLQTERAELGGTGTDWLKPMSALCSPLLPPIPALVVSDALSPHL